MAGLVPQHRAAIDGTQDKGGDDRALGTDLCDLEGAPAAPAALGRGQILINAGLARDQDVGQEPVGLAPGVQDFLGRRLAQDMGDGAEQGVGYVGIVFRQDLQADVLLGDAFDGCGQGAKIIDVVGVGQDGAGQGAGLGPGVAVVRLVEQVADLRVLEHPRIHLVDDLETLGFKGGNSGFDKRDRALAEGLRHQCLLG
ncbi:hypothetical protein D3C87_1545500 [compost metagenome]